MRGRRTTRHRRMVVIIRSSDQTPDQAARDIALATRILLAAARRADAERAAAHGNCEPAGGQPEANTNTTSLNAHGDRGPDQGRGAVRRAGPSGKAFQRPRWGP